MEKTAILFDLDGTLWDSSEAVVSSWNEVIATLPDFHRQGTVEDMMGLMGKTMDQIAYEYFDTVPKERALELMKLCTDHENDYIRQHGGKLMPKLEETLKELSEKYFLAIVSNCQKGYIEAFLEYHRLGGYFRDHSDYGTLKLSKGENIRQLLVRDGLERAFYVGDIQGDCDAAHYAGIPFIHASYGFGKVKDADYRIEAFEELPALMEKVK
ncbi:MAG: HAD family hydrolase [Lachnospiraceae bacterium]|nr:HAD family hydrolase [Lachnospiraceae bacterium]